MKKLEIKYSNNKSVVIDSYEKHELNDYLLKERKDKNEFISVEINDLNLYIEKKYIIFEKFSYMYNNDIEFYKKLISDKNFMSKFKIIQIMVEIFHFIFIISFMFFLIVSIYFLISNFYNLPIMGILVSFIISLISFIFLVSIDKKNKKILKEYMKDIIVDKMLILNDESDELNCIEKFDYKKEDEIIFKIKEKMQEKLLYR